jgi:hypothetical protein
MRVFGISISRCVGRLFRRQVRNSTAKRSNISSDSSASELAPSGGVQRVAARREEALGSAKSANAPCSSPSSSSSLPPGRMLLGKVTVASSELASGCARGSGQARGAH